ncbi:MAG: hypothetical protein U0X40_03425 [Ferruginibacter sp.]
MSEWSNLFVATAGAAAALTGLIFVGVSINLTKILSARNLPTRALLSLTLLFTILVLSIIFLIPGQDPRHLGTEIILVGILVWLAVSIMDFAVLRSIDKAYKRQQVFSTLLDQVAILPYVIGGILVVTTGVSGVYWITIAFIFSFLKALIDAWVLLVEIHR